MSVHIIVYIADINYSVSITHVCYTYVHNAYSTHWL